MLVPVIGALYPLLRMFPALSGWYMRRRVALLYGDLELIELAIDGGATGEARDHLLARLDQLEARASHLQLPKGFAALAYAFQHHIRLVRERLQQRP